MMALALAALLSFQDPAGDTVGNGSLTAPTAAVFRNLSSFDLLGVNLLDAPTLQFELTFAALPNPLELPNGFSLPIVELYVGDETVGSPELLPGSSMDLPGGATWHYALRLTGDRAQVFVADSDTVTELGMPEASSETTVAGASAAAGSTGETSLGGTPELGGAEGVPEGGVSEGVLDGVLDVSVADTVITVKTSLPRPQSLTLYGLVGSYSPFSDSGWQALSAAPSPWAFSSPDQTVPVVDVLAEDETAQARAVDSQTLPGLRRAAPPAAPRANPWLLLVAGGFVVALVGVVGRFTVPKPAFRTGLPPEVYEQAEAAGAHADAPPPSAPDQATEPALTSPSTPETFDDADTEAEPLETERSTVELLDTERLEVGSPETAVDTPASATSEGLNPESADPAALSPATADLETWVTNEPPRPERPVTERLPNPPETHPPATEAGGVEEGRVQAGGVKADGLKAVLPLELRREDWPEPEDADLWRDVARADERADGTAPPSDADVKHL